MEAQENPFIRITVDDVNEANQLSLHCPICANPVERYATEPSLAAVECVGCGALYHKTCREQAGGACAMIGCDEKQYRPYGELIAPEITLSKQDMPGDGRQLNKELKRQEQLRRRRELQSNLLSRFFAWLLRQIRILNE